MAWGSVRGVRLGIRKRNRLLMEVITAARLPGALGQGSEAHGVMLGLPCAGAGIGFDDSFGPFQLRKFYNHRNIYSKIL